MVRYQKNRILIIYLLILVCSVFLGGCGTGQSEKDLVGGVHVTLNSTENTPLPVFAGRLAVIREGDLWVLESGKAPHYQKNVNCTVARRHYLIFVRSGFTL